MEAYQLVNFCNIHLKDSISKHQSNQVNPNMLQID